MSNSMSWLSTLRVSSSTARLDWVWFWLCCWCCCWRWLAAYMPPCCWRPTTFMRRGSTGSGSSSVWSKRSLEKLPSSKMSAGSSESTWEVMSTDLASCSWGVSMAAAAALSCGSMLRVDDAMLPPWSPPKREAAIPSRESPPRPAGLLPLPLLPPPRPEPPPSGRPAAQSKSFLPEAPSGPLRPPVMGLVVALLGADSDWAAILVEDDSAGDAAAAALLRAIMASKP
mmetsp:Transcript_25616/g.71573  ORF Transcript_25616/g.71573 Transcript_25616/m.71573 type:complete len:227 (-) Transcript_25616:357-1037(-)